MIAFEHRRLPGLTEEDLILFIVPDAHVRIGREQLQDDGRSFFPAKTQITAAAQPYFGAVRVTTQCGRGLVDGSSWGFAEDLTPDEVDILARTLLREQLSTYRTLFAVGVCAHLNINFGEVEQVALRKATTQRRREIEVSLPSLTEPQRELAKLDLWLLTDFVFHFSVSVDWLLHRTLGENAASVRSRIRRADRIRESLSARVRELICPRNLSSLEPPNFEMKC